MSSVTVSKEDNVKYHYMESTKELDLLIDNDGLQQTIRFMDMESIDNVLDTLHSARRIANMKKQKK